MADSQQKSGVPTQILRAIDGGKNIIIHAPGGTGKTLSLRRIARYLKIQGKCVYCTATTGVAAINLNIPEDEIYASTLHSWGGVGLAREDASKICAKIMSKNKKARERWEIAEILIIDEVSMLGAEFIDKLNYIGQELRKNYNQPFGGIQLILSGDFLQLPPVKDEWAFESGTWKELNLHPIVLDKPIRYDDEVYFRLLLRVRKGTCTITDHKKLRARVRAYDKLHALLKKEDNTKVIKPTILYSRRIDVDNHNSQEMEKLPGEEKVYIAEDTFAARRKGVKRDRYEARLDNTIPQIVALKVGAQVMLKTNLDIEQGLVNGSRGVVMELGDDFAFVRFINGVRLRIFRNVWKDEDKDAVFTRSQLPFILAWGITIHKGQGATLDYAICDLGPSIFAAGQAYVALSRVRNLRGLFISEFYQKSIQVDKKALKYVQTLEGQAEGSCEILIENEKQSEKPENEE